MVHRIEKKFSWDEEGDVDREGQMILFLRTCVYALVSRRGMTPQTALDIIWETCFIFFKYEYEYHIESDDDDDDDDEHHGGSLPAIDDK